MEHLKIKVPLEYSYLHVVSNSQEDVFRVKEVRNGDQAEEFVRRLSEENKTTWRIGKTYPHVGTKLIYRKDYRCQHQTDPRHKGNTKGTKNTNCPAKLHVTIQRYRENSRSPFNPEILKEYATEVVLKGVHNHPIYSSESLRYRDMSQDTRAKLTKFFLEGHTPSSALNTLKFHLLCEHPDDYKKVSSDGYYLPALSVVYTYYKKLFNDFAGQIKGKKIYPSLEELAEKFEKHSKGIVKLQNRDGGACDHIVVITELMMRGHKLKQSADTVLVDSSLLVEKKRLRAFIFATPTSAGGVPLGIVVTEDDRETVLRAAFLCLKEQLERTGAAFYGVGYPKMILTNNQYSVQVRERKSLKNAFPKSAVFLCQFHVLKWMWTWLCSKKNNIATVHRQDFYFLFKRVVYSFVDADAVQYGNEFLEEVNNLGYHNLADHFKKMWEKRSDWISCYRKDLLTQYTELECSDNTLLFEKVMNDQISAEELLEFESLVGRIKDRLTTNPNEFVPAFRRMLENAKAYAATDSGLAAAMTGFGTQAAVPPSAVGELVRLDSSAAAPPPSASLIKSLPDTEHLLEVREKLIERRQNSEYRQRKLRLRHHDLPPQLEQHDYTNFGSVSKLKRKKKTDLERGVKNNIQLCEVNHFIPRSPKSEPSNNLVAIPADFKFDQLSSSSKIIVLMNVDDNWEEHSISS